MTATREIHSVPTTKRSTGVGGWARMIPLILGDGAWEKFPNLKRLHDEISARPAAARAVALKDKHKFKAELDDEARSHMFKHLAANAA